MKQPKLFRILSFNAPVVLSMTLLSFLILLVGMPAGNWLGRNLAVGYSSWASPMQYVRLFTHIFAHADMAHFTSNFLLILAVGPMVEEKYGSASLGVMIGVTAVITGLVQVLFFRGTALMGASGIVFMLILLASFVNIREGTLPVTVILVAVLYLGNEIAAGIFINDSVSRISHIIGGLCGAGFGFLLNRGRWKKR